MTASLKKSFSDLLAQQVAPWLSDRGFSRKGSDFGRKSDVCVQHIAVTLDEKTKTEGVVYYFAYLEYPRVELLLSHGRHDSDAVNTLGQQMGHLHGARKFEEWPFATQTDLEAFGARLCRDFEEYALPFLEKYSSPDNVIHALESGELFNLDAKASRLTLASFYYLGGRPEKAIELLDKSSEEFNGRPYQLRFEQMKKYLSTNP
jgi:hypothetical protein